MDGVNAEPAVVQTPQGRDLKVAEVRALRAGLKGKISVKIVGPGFNVKRYFSEGDTSNQQVARKTIQDLEADGLMVERNNQMWTTDQGKAALDGHEARTAERRGAAASALGDGPKPRIQVGKLRPLL